MATTTEVRRCTRIRGSPLMTGLVSNQAPSSEPRGSAACDRSMSTAGHQCPKTAGLLTAPMPCLERF